MAAAGLTVSITAQFFAAKASVGFATELRQAVLRPCAEAFLHRT